MQQIRRVLCGVHSSRCAVAMRALPTLDLAFDGIHDMQ